MVNELDIADFRNQHSPSHVCHSFPIILFAGRYGDPMRNHRLYAHHEGGAVGVRGSEALTEVCVPVLTRILPQCTAVLASAGCESELHQLIRHLMGSII